MGNWLVAIGVSMLVVFGAHSCIESQWFKNAQSEAAQRWKEQQTPHVVREVDGCKVYAFERGGYDHYFTRCPGSITTTESSRSVSCGKGCTKIETESIEARP